MKTSFLAGHLQVRTSNDYFQLLLTYRPRSYALHRMDSIFRLAGTSNYTLPEPVLRSGYLCLSLCFRVLRGHESIQISFGWLATAFQTGEEHGKTQWQLCADSPAHIQWRSID